MPQVTGWSPWSAFSKKPVRLVYLESSLTLVFLLSIFPSTLLFGYKLPLFFLIFGMSQSFSPTTKPHYNSPPWIKSNLPLLWKKIRVWAITKLQWTFPCVLCHFGLIDLPLWPTHSRNECVSVLCKSYINVDLFYDFLMQTSRQL